VVNAVNTVLVNDANCVLVSACIPELVIAETSTVLKELSCELVKAAICCELKTATWLVVKTEIKVVFKLCKSSVLIPAMAVVDNCCIA
jgi:hypothetical protein